MATIDDVLSAIDSGQKAALDRLFAFLSIPSISAVPAHFPDCERAADWLVTELGDLGFEASKRPTAGRPMVVGHIAAARREAPNVLFYGHYDVQPVDPLKSLAQSAVRAEARVRAAWRRDRGPRRERRQRPAHDLSRSLPRLQAIRRPSLQYHRAVRRRGRDGIAFPAGLSGRERQRAEGRCRAGLRHGHVGPLHAGDHDRAARDRRPKRSSSPAPIAICTRAFMAAWPSTRSMCCRRSSASCTTIPARSRSPASMTASRRFRRNSRTSGTSSISTAGRSCARSG